MSCKCGQRDDQMFLYRDKMGKSVFTGFVQNKNGNITWIGKNEKSFRPILSDEDCVFFMNEMKQYDR